MHHLPRIAARAAVLLLVVQSVCLAQKAPAAERSKWETDPRVQRTVADAARQTNTDPAAVRIVSVESREWPDASLGCPKPGQVYAQVITPGLLIVLEAGGKRFEYHTDAGQRIEQC